MQSNSDGGRLNGMIQNIIWLKGQIMAGNIEQLDLYEHQESCIFTLVCLSSHAFINFRLQVGLYHEWHKCLSGISITIYVLYVCDLYV